MAEPFFQTDLTTLHPGDLREVLPGLPPNSIDCVCTDPPYGLGFMKKDWDHEVPGPEYWRAIARVCKPGAFLLAFGGTRTYHRLVCAIEDASWEIRDCLLWLYGQGFPKASDIGRLIDKAKGAKREVVGTKLGRPGYSLADNGRTNEVYGDLHSPEAECAITAPATPEAAIWTGWAMALKPAWEPILLAMKPMDGTIAANALAWGVAGLNIDASRIPCDYAAEYGEKWLSSGKGKAGPWHGTEYEETRTVAERVSPLGRWPANVLLDEEAAAQLDAQTGILTSGMMKPGQQRKRSKGKGGYHGDFPDEATATGTHGDAGGASRFFYCAKSSRQERNLGLADFFWHQPDRSTDWQRITQAEYDRLADENEAAEAAGRRPPHALSQGNAHATVKPQALMSYLLTLLSTPSGGVVLDPFAGSGSTLLAAQRLGRRSIGVELGRENCEIIQARLVEG